MSCIPHSMARAALAAGKCADLSTIGTVLAKAKRYDSGMTRKDAQALAKKLNSENVRFEQ